MSSDSSTLRILTKTLNVQQKADWTAVVNDKNVFLSLPYLQTLEETLPDVTLIYAITYDVEKKPVFVAVFQIVEFVYKRNFKYSTYFKTLPRFLGTKGDFSIKMAVCGNVFATGQHGFAHTLALSKTEAIQALNQHITRLQNDKVFNELFSAVLLKEFWKDNTSKHAFLQQEHYHEFEIDVNMVLAIDPHWQSFEAYVEGLKAKYRTRVNSVFKKSKDLKLKSLNAQEILEHSEIIMQLYDNVLQNSDYTYGVLSPDTFSAFKENLGDTFSFTTAFKDNRMIGFSTAFYNGTVMEANYVGLDYKYNASFAVYQRLLYHYLEQAITAKCTELQLGRTSELIKSALGAKPKAMQLYAKHNNNIANKLASKILSKIVPSNFELRTPFKSEI